MPWTKVEEGLPPNCNPVIAFGVNSSGKNRTIRAAYARRFELEANRDCGDDDWGEYCEEKDEYFAPDGWYEWNDAEEIHWRVEFQVSHWQPLPEAPNVG